MAGLVRAIHAPRPQRRSPGSAADGRKGEQIFFDLAARLQSFSAPNMVVAGTSPAMTQLALRGDNRLQIIRN